MLLGLSSCSLLATRPLQEMSFSSAAIRAAKEVQADTLAPEYFRQSNEWFSRAKREYKLKNFLLARESANKARYYAERAEFEALRGGGVRNEQGSGPDPLGKDPMAEEGAALAPKHPDENPKHEYPVSSGIPAEDYEKRKSENKPVETKKVDTPKLF